MKYILFLIVLFFSSFNLEYRERWVCHTIIERPTMHTCYVVIVKADTRSEAEKKFRKRIKEKEIEWGGKESKEPVYLVSKLKDAIMIEP